MTAKKTAPSAALSKDRAVAVTAKRAASESSRPRRPRPTCSATPPAQCMNEAADGTDAKAKPLRMKVSAPRSAR